MTKINGKMSTVAVIIALATNFGGIVWFAAVVATNGKRVSEDVKIIKAEVKQINREVTGHISADEQWMEDHERQHKAETDDR